MHGPPFFVAPLAFGVATLSGSDVLGAGAACAAGLWLSRGLPERPLESLVGMARLFVLLYGAAVLLGAPLTELVPRTAALSAFLAGSVLGSGARTPDDLLRVRAAQGALLGAFCGCAGIPLDWDRPWQAWPWPCLAGAAVGQLLACVVWLWEAESKSM